MPVEKKKAHLRESAGQELSFTLETRLANVLALEGLRVTALPHMSNQHLARHQGTCKLAGHLGSSSLSALTVRFSNDHVFTLRLWDDKKGIRSHSFS